MKSFRACDVRFGHARAFMRIASLRQADGLIVAVARMYQSDDFFSEIYVRIRFFSQGIYSS